jgi:hypothetical protein
MKNLTEYSSQQLEQAIAIKKQIELLEIQLSKLAGGSGLRGRPKMNRLGQGGMNRDTTPKRRRRFSAQTRAKIAAAAKARWAKAKAKGRNTL